MEKFNFTAVLMTFSSFSLSLKLIKIYKYNKRGFLSNVFCQAVANVALTLLLFKRELQWFSHKRRKTAASHWPKL